MMFTLVQEARTGSPSQVVSTASEFNWQENMLIIQDAITGNLDTTLFHCCAFLGARNWKSSVPEVDASEGCEGHSAQANFSLALFVCFLSLHTCVQIPLFLFWCEMLYGSMNIFHTILTQMPTFHVHINNM